MKHKFHSHFLRLTLKVKLNIAYKYGQIFREVVNVPAIEWCNQMEGLGSNPAMNMAVDLIKESVPQLFHKCPYEVSFNICEIIHLVLFLQGFDGAS